MTTVTFDTLRFVEQLTAAGVPEAQARAEAAAIREALGGAEVATHRDVELVRQDVRELELRTDARFERIDGKLTLVQWMLALVVAAEVMPILVSLFHLKANP